jgi:SAM-dependent methyltransferase
MTVTYANVDGSSDPARALEWQERIDAWPAMQAYKRIAFERLEGARVVLDVGCGPGEDAAAIAPGAAVGMDSSRLMCERASTRVEQVVRGSADRLPFRDEAFEAARADRVIQHLADPETALHEMARVTRSQGRIVVADPDQETLTIHVPGVPTAITDKLKELRRDVGYRNGTFARELPARFREIGLRDITIDATTLVLTDPGDAFGVPSWPIQWREVGGFSDGDVALWERGIRQARRAGMIYAVTYFVVAGTKR